ncbi:MAG: cell division protein FtsQ/DivIB, partial [Solirubrobacteraceae bacterium]
LPLVGRPAGSPAHVSASWHDVRGQGPVRWPRKRYASMRASTVSLPLGGFPRLPRIGGRARRVALAGSLVLAVLGGSWLWFRDSSFASVEQVRITGLNGIGAGPIEAALARSARGMTTLDFSAGALRAAVASYPEVRSLSVTTSFPHRVDITVAEQLPAAVLQTPAGPREDVAGDGALLGSPGAVAQGASLPVVSVAALPHGRVRDAQTLEDLAVLGAAPAPLLALAAGAQSTARGLRVTWRDGLPVYFGDGTGARAKWLAFAAALLASGATGVTYVDVRFPARPAVGTTDQAGTAAGGSAAATGAGAGNVAALIAGLKATIGGEHAEAASAAPQGTSEESSTSSAQGAAEAQGAAGAGAGSQTPPQEAPATTAHGEHAEAQGNQEAPSASGASPAPGG